MDHVFIDQRISCKCSGCNTFFTFDNNYKWQAKKLLHTYGYVIAQKLDTNTFEYDIIVLYSTYYNYKSWK